MAAVVAVVVVVVVVVVVEVVVVEVVELAQPDQCSRLPTERTVKRQVISFDSYFRFWLLLKSFSAGKL